MNLFAVAWLAVAALAVLKLAGLAAISWWTVFAPILLAIVVFIVVLTLMFIWMWNK